MPAFVSGAAQETTAITANLLTLTANRSRESGNPWSGAQGQVFKVNQHLMNQFQMATLMAEQAASGQNWLPFLDIDTLTVGLYHVRESDAQTHQPHSRDEVYYVLSGEGVLRVEDVDYPVSTGAVLFVPARQRHHYHSVSRELTLLVFFSNAAPQAEVVLPGGAAA